MFDDIKTENMFTTPISRMLVADYPTLNAALMAEGARMRAQSDGVQASNRGGWHSDGNIFAQEAECFVQLRKLALTAALTLTKSIGATVDLSTLTTSITGWMNVNGRGAFNAPHTHPGFIWSGVYYVAQPSIDEGTSGMIEFLDPRSDLPNWRFLAVPGFQPKWRFRPAAGELVLFPSYLTHWVYPNDVDEDRISIAFNIALNKKDNTPKTAP